MSLAIVLEQWLLSMNLLPCRYVVLRVTCIGLNVGVRTFAQIFFEIQWLHFLQRMNHAPVDTVFWTHIFRRVSGVNEV